MSTPSWAGRSVERFEDHRLLTGAGRFADDFAERDVLYCAIVRSSVAHARIRRIDTTRAQALPGVVAVVTGAQAVDLWNPIPSMMVLEGARVVRSYAMASDTVVYDGEAIACVAAESRHAARDAAELVEVEYEPLPAIATIDEALGHGGPPATRLYEDWDDNIQLAWAFDSGDADAALAASFAVVASETGAQRYSGVPLEPRAVLAQADRGDGTLSVRLSTQYPHQARSVIASVFGLAEADVQVRAGDVGGGYGNKLTPEQELIPILLARVTGQPVKWTETRGEWLRSGCGARDFRSRTEAGFDADGRLLGLRVNVDIDVGCDGVVRHIGTAAALIAGSYLSGLYDVEHLSARIRAVVTNKAPYGSYRAFGKEIATQSIERLMDAGARALAVDPIELRRRNLIREFPHQLCTGPVVEGGAYATCLDRVVEAMDVDALRRRQRDARARGRYLGVAVATFLEPSGAAIPSSMFSGVETATVRVAPDGSALVLTGMQPIGQGIATSVAQVAADRLGLDPAGVRVLFGDTNVIAQGQGSYSSRGASYGLMAVYEAAGVVRDKMARVAAELLEAPASELVLSDGGFAMPDDPGSRVTVAQIARAVYHAPGVRALLPDEPGLTLEGDHTWSSPLVSWQPDEQGRMRLYPIHGGGAIGAVVEVDVETGQVAVQRVWIAHDAGRLINPAIVEGQVVGAVAQGLGGALLEQLAYDADAQMAGPTLNDYQLPNFLSVPPVEVLHVETPLDTPLGSKGVGEAGAIATPTVLLAAVEDALRPFSARVTASPLTPARVLDILDAAAKPLLVDTDRGQVL